MRKYNHNGVNGWLDESTNRFWQEGELEPFNYQDQNGLLDPTTNEFYPVAIGDIAGSMAGPAAAPLGAAEAVEPLAGTAAAVLPYTDGRGPSEIDVGALLDTGQLKPGASYPGLQTLKGIPVAPGMPVGPPHYTPMDPVGRGLARGSLQTLENIATTGEALTAPVVPQERTGPGIPPSAVLDWFMTGGPPGKDKLGQAQTAYRAFLHESVFKPAAKKFGESRAMKSLEASEIARQDITQNPKALLDPRWWIENTAEMLPSTITTLAAALAGGPVIGGYVGGQMEGADVYRQMIDAGETPENAAKAMGMMTAGSGVLNAAQLGWLFKKAPTVMQKVVKYAGATVGEGLTEAAEEPLGEAIQQIVKGKYDPEQMQLAWRQGANVFFPALLTGLLGLPFGEAVGTAKEQKEAAEQQKPSEEEIITKESLLQMLFEQARAARDAQRMEQALDLERPLPGALPAPTGLGVEVPSPPKGPLPQTTEAAAPSLPEEAAPEERRLDENAKLRGMISKIDDMLRETYDKLDAYEEQQRLYDERTEAIRQSWEKKKQAQQPAPQPPPQRQQLTEEEFIRQRDEHREKSRTGIPDAVRVAIEEAGMTPEGMQEEVSGPPSVLFTDPQTGSTLQMPAEGITPDAVRRHANERRAEFEEPARVSAIGVISFEPVERIEKAGYEIVRGEMERGSELYYDVVGVVGGGRADRLFDAGLTVKRITKQATTTATAEQEQTDTETPIWRSGAEPAAAVPGEPIEYFGRKADFSDTSAGLFVTDKGDYYIQREDGSFVYNPYNESETFKTAEEAKRMFEHYEKKPRPEPLMAPLEVVPEETAPAAPTEPVPEPQATRERGEGLADWVQKRLAAGESFTKPALQLQAQQEFGGTREGGTYTPKDMFDAMEVGINRYIASRKELSTSGDVSVDDAKLMVETIRSSIIDAFPSEEGVRTAEQDEFQQFSTIPDTAYVMAWAANPQANDVVLEPSAGTGGLTAFMRASDVARIYGNELSKRRAALLKLSGTADRIFNENAEQLNNILPKDVRPTLIIMNPPFSSTAGRIEGERSAKNVVQHLDQALARLQPNGRLVALLGRPRPPFTDSKMMRDWFSETAKKHTVYAVVNISGKGYKKYGTTYGNRIVVIDKTPPGEHSAFAGLDALKPVDDVSDALPLLEGVRYARRPIEQAAEQPGGEVVARPDRMEPRPERAPVRPEPAPVEPGKPAPGPRRPGVATERGADVGESEEPAEIAGIPLDEYGGGRAGGAAPGGRAAGTAAERGEGPGGRGEGAAGQARPEPPSRPEPVEPVSKPEFGAQVAIGIGEKKKYAKSDLTDAIFEAYTPQKLKIEGAKPHVSKLVQSSAMASVEPPAPTYKPSLPEKIIKEGKLSLAQLEAVVYAGQAHAQMLRDGKRRGFFIGDGTGVGKGREISGILLDNWNQGRKKALWMSASSSLVADARRDISGIDWDPDVVFDLTKTRLGSDIGATNGVLFTTYNTLAKGSTSDGNGNYRKHDKSIKEDKQTRLDQIVNWLGTDFDGVIVFDEAHKMQNNTAMKGSRGNTKPSNTAITGLELMNRLPNARVVYVSATGATRVDALGYADRLGMWGQGTAFADRRDFMNQIGSGGLAVMEVVAQDMKAMGRYISRNLDYSDVSYERLEHKLDDHQVELYNKFSDAWQLIFKNVQGALEATGAKNNGAAKSAAMSMFWGTQQRFYNQLLTAIQMPSVVADMKRQLAQDRSCVLQFVNTNEAILDRQLALMEDDEALEDLDLTPREYLMQYVKGSFPVQQFENYLDENGNMRSRPVTDSAGNPVENAEAVQLREEMLDQIGSLKFPKAPLEFLFDIFGRDEVAEVTGRSKRTVKVKDQTTGQMKTVVERWSKRKGEHDADLFNAGKKRILLFSDAGGTGRSFHSDRTYKNQQKRVHYVLQPGWRADNAVQGLGRTHRTNQANAPHVMLVVTNLPGHRRFISTIARRLDQLGALTKGQRQAASQGLFSAADNLESTHSAEALIQFFVDLHQKRVEGLTLMEVAEPMGLEGLIDENGRLNMNKIPNMGRFLNRMLSLSPGMQDSVFEAYNERLQQNLERAMASGELDMGVETYRADGLTKEDERVVYKHPESTAETVYVKMKAKHAVVTIPFDKAKAMKGHEGFIRNKQSKKVWAVKRAGNKTDESGRVFENYRLSSPVAHNYRIVDLDELRREGWEKVTDEDAAKAWESQLAETPKHREETLHVISGALLPIWDRLPKDRPRVLRMQTDEGERYLGRLVHPNAIDGVLRALGAETKKGGYDASDAFTNILEDGHTARLANGWKIKRSLVDQEWRPEIVADDIYRFSDQLVRLGVIKERINFATRFFLPTGPTGEKLFKRIVEDHPIVDMSVPSKGKGGGGGGTFGMTPKEGFRREPETARTEKAREGKPQKRSEIVKFLAENLGVPIRTGRFRKVGGRIGIYKQRDKVIRSAEANDMPVIAHETGHAIQDYLWPESLKSKKGWRKTPLGNYYHELNGLTEKFLAKKQQGDIAEGFAEFLRLYITDEAMARKEAPGMFSYFDQLVAEQHNEIHEILLQARDDYRRWMEQPAAARILGHLSIGETTKRSRTWEDVYTATFDDLNPLRQAVEEMSEGKELNTADDPYKLARLMRGFWGKADAWLDYQPFNFKSYAFEGRSLREILKPHEQDLDGLRIYLVAKRAIELKKKRNIESGILMKDAEQIVAEGADKYADTARDIYEYGKQQLRYLRDAGLLSADAAHKMMLLNEFHVPFYRVFDEKGRGGGTGKGLEAHQPVKRIKGSARDIMDPLESLVKNTYLFLNLAEKNAIGTALVNLAEKKEGMGKFIEKVPKPLWKVKVDPLELLRAVKDPEIMAELAGGGLSEDAIDIFRPSAFFPKDGFISIWRGGNRELYQVSNEIDRAFKALDVEQATVLMRIASLPAKWLRAGATLTPEFIGRNPIRDQFSAFIYSKYGFFPALDWGKGIFHAVKKDDIYWKWKIAGGEHATLVSLDRKYLQRSLDRVLRDRGVFVPENWRDMMKNPINALRIASEFGEAGTRLGEFAKVLSKEGHDKEALLSGGFASREVTLDFARIGAKTRGMNMVIAFWNAQLQGTDKMVRAFKARPLTTSLRVMLAITIPSILLELGQGDDGRYDELDDWQKDLFWIFLPGFVSKQEWARMTPQQKVRYNKEHPIWRVPKPFEIGIIFGTLPQRMIRWIRNKDPKAMEGMLKTIMEGMSPGFIPTAAVPLVENMADRSLLTGQNIVPAERKDVLPKFQYRHYTTESAKKIGALISKMPMIGDTGAASPAKIENLVRGWTGGLGRYVLQLTDIALKQTGAVKEKKGARPTGTWSDVPFVKAFSVRFPSAGTSSIRRFYDNYNEAEQIYKTANILAKKEHDKERAQEYMSSGYAKHILRMQSKKAVDMIHKTMAGIDTNERFTADEKRDMMDRLYFQIIDIAKNANEAYERQEKRRADQQLREKLRQRAGE